MIKVLSNELMRSSDKMTLSKISEKDLMYKAGTAIFKAIKWEQNIAIVCGTGNNAGDGFVLALLLKEAKLCPVIFLIEERFSESGAYYFNLCKEKEIRVEKLDENTSFSNYDMIVDAIFGTGFKGEVNKRVAAVIDLINKSNKYTVSVDINSGLNGNSGMGDAVVNSDITLSIGYYKSGHFLNMAKDVMKKKLNLDIGIELNGAPYYLIESSDIKSCFKERLNYSNKSTYGYVSLIGGSTLYSGAIRLATMAHAAMRSGAGVTRVCAVSSLKDQIMPLLLEETFYPLSEVNGHIAFKSAEFEEIIKKARVITIGMGLTCNFDTIKIIEFLLANYRGILIIDADGLNALSKLDESIIKNAAPKIVLTPHIMELSRLIKRQIDEILIDPIKEIIEYAQRTNTTILLKGPSTCITDGKTVYIVSTGSSGMATAGSGDVLSGILTSTIASNQDDILKSVAAGAYLNGLAGELATNKYTDISMIASDTISMIPEAIKKIRE